MPLEHCVPEKKDVLMHPTHLSTPQLKRKSVNKAIVSEYIIVVGLPL